VSTHNYAQALHGGRLGVAGLRVAGELPSSMGSFSVVLSSTRRSCFLTLPALKSQHPERCEQLVALPGIVPVMQDANISNWINTLAEIQPLEVNAQASGHGELMTMAEVKALQGANVSFYAGVGTGVEKGKDKNAIRKTLNLAHRERLEPACVIGRNINRPYIKIENARVDR